MDIFVSTREDGFRGGLALRLNHVNRFAAFTGALLGYSPAEELRSQGGGHKTKLNNDIQHAEDVY